MQDIELLSERAKLYRPLYRDLEKKKIKYNENLILCEIFIDKQDQLKIKKLINKYIAASIEAFYGIKIKSYSSILNKYKKYILNLPNITPNGVIVPKRENFLSYFKIQNSVFNLCTEYSINKIYDKIELCEIRLMRSNKYNYNSKRSYASSKIHSDTWSGNPCDSKIALYIDGDKKNTINFYKPKKINKSFFSKKKNYDTAIKKYGFKKLKPFNHKCLTIFDQACLHQTMNKDKDLRLSLDFGITLKSIKEKKKFSNRYKNRFFKNKLGINKIKKLLNLKSIHEKY